MANTTFSYLPSCYHQLLRLYKAWRYAFPYAYNKKKCSLSTDSIIEGLALEVLTGWTFHICLTKVFKERLSSPYLVGHEKLCLCMGWDTHAIIPHKLKPQKPTIARKFAWSYGHTLSMAPHCLRMGLNLVSGWASAWFMRSLETYWNLRYRCHSDSCSPMDFNIALGSHVFYLRKNKPPGDSREHSLNPQFLVFSVVSALKRIPNPFEHRDLNMFPHELHSRFEMDSSQLVVIYSPYLVRWYVCSAVLVLFKIKVGSSKLDLQEFSCIQWSTVTVCTWSWEQEGKNSLISIYHAHEKAHQFVCVKLW